MNTSKTLRTILLLALAVGLGGCDTMAKMVGDRRPTVTLRDVQFQDMTLADVTMLFEVEIANHYNVPLPLVNTAYTLASGGKPFLSGASQTQRTIPALGSERVMLPVTLSFAELLAALPAVRPGTLVDYDANLSLGLDLPGLGEVTVPLRKQGQLPVPAAPQVQLASVEWRSLTLSEATAVLHLEVTNTNAFRVAMEKLGANLWLAGAEVGRVGVEQPLALDSGKRGSLAIPISVSTARLGTAALNTLRQRRLSYQLDGQMNLGTPYGPLDASFQRSGETDSKPPQ